MRSTHRKALTGRRPPLDVAHREGEGGRKSERPTGTGKPFTFAGQLHLGAVVLTLRIGGPAQRLHYWQSPFTCRTACL
jgi:hypothetical protein